MKTSFIGVSPRYLEDPVSHTKSVKINMDYINQITKYNKTPLILFDGPNFDENLKLCDGFIVIGGNDIDPSYFNETNDLGLSKEIDQLTDEIDYKIIKYAKENQVPLLGICRGHQALAAFLGGSIYQDFNYYHQKHQETDHKHLIQKVNNGKLANLLPDSFLVNSFHHQSVNKLPEDFISTFVNQDVNEAIEHQFLPLIGVQWHPERYYTKESKIIFDYFYELVDEYIKSKK